MLELLFKRDLCMNKAEIIKALSGNEKILAYIQTQSWKTAFHHILSAEELEKSTNIDNVEEMYRKVLSHGIVHLEIELVDEKPHCIAGWSQNRNQLGSETAELICIHSLENQRRQGYGSVMMKHLLHEIKQAGYSEVILWFLKKIRLLGIFMKNKAFIHSNENILVQLNLHHGDSK